jgi:hypothetical protein
MFRAGKNPERYAIWIFILFRFFACCSAARAQDVVFVANTSVPASSISASDLHAIFTGEKTRFPDGSHAVPVILKGGPAHEVFLKNYCGEGPSEFRAQWRKAIFTGQGSMPPSFDSEAALIEYVSVTSGAVGYVSHLSPHQGVKVITVLK